MVTQKQIAKEAGVSIAAVSYVLSGRHNEVGSEVRQRIEQIAHHHHYQANALVHALRTKRTHILGVLVPSVQFSFFPQIIDGIETEARQLGYQVVICQTHNDHHLLEKAVTKLGQQRTDGLILCPSQLQSDYYQRLREAGARLVFLDEAVEGVDAPAVDSDDGLGACLATRHLIRLGHRRIATLRAPPADPAPTAGARLEGYHNALREAAISFDERLVIESKHYSIEDGAHAIRELLRSTEFTAFFAPTDMAAIGAMQALQEAGKSVPRDVALVGYGNLHEGLYLTPSLTTVDQKPAEMGAAAVRLLMDLIENRSPSAPRTIMTTPELVIRQSCGATSTRTPT